MTVVMGSEMASMVAPSRAVTLAAHLLLLSISPDPASLDPVSPATSPGAVMSCSTS